MLPSSAVRVAIIGAGLSGLTCARQLLLRSRGASVAQVTLFDKYSRVGGRLATTPHVPSPVPSRSEEQRLAVQFDHGAQYFTVRSRAFRETLDVLNTRFPGKVREWKGRLGALACNSGVVEDVHNDGTRFVATPDQNALPGSLCEDLQAQLEEQGREAELRVVLNTFVSRVERTDEAQWKVHDADGEELGAFDLVVVALPAPQTAQLLERSSSECAPLAKKVGSVKYAGCWCGMLGVRSRPALPYDGLFVNATERASKERSGSLPDDEEPQQPSLTWMARNSAKPERPDSQLESWVLHSSLGFFEANAERPAAEIADEMKQLFVEMASKVTGEQVDATVTHARAHRWLYSYPLQTLDVPFVFDEDLALGVCGDYCGGSRVEGAFTSGWQLGARLHDTLTSRL